MSVCSEWIDGPDHQVPCMRQEGHDGHHVAMLRHLERPFDDLCPICHGRMRTDEYGFLVCVETGAQIDA